MPSLVETIPQPIVILKGFTNGVIANCNEQFKRQIGLEPTSYQGNSSIATLFPSVNQKNKHY